MARQTIMMDGNEAVAYVAHKINEVIAIYPITPSSSMGEWADEWSSKGEKNIWGTVPLVCEMQSEGGAVAAVHGALQTGSLTTTFTASQGLLLMIPSMFKIAGELTPTVFHVSARSIAAQALSIFGDHSDVMAVRTTGFGLIASGSVQEAMDFALISSAASLEARIPFVHFFDGFRVSHEVSNVELLTEDDLKIMMNDDLVLAHRSRGMSPDHPVLRGTSQNPDVYFQGRETVNSYYLKTPEIIQNAMDRFAARTGRQYHLFDYVGAPDAERVIIIIGSAGEAVHECVERLNGQGEKVGVVKVHLYRPFSIDHFIAALPETTQKIAVLDRTKEPGSAGEPLYLDCVNALVESGRTQVSAIGGRYGLSSKEFTPAMVKGIFDELKQPQPKNHFTIGIVDDVTHTSLAYDRSFDTESANTTRALFYGLGSDGTVGANKNSIKIIGEKTDNFAQGYFVYDSKKAGAITVSHLRFGPEPIRSSYRVTQADFVACHQSAFLDTYDLLRAAAPGGTFLLNAPHPTEAVWDTLPHAVQQQIIDKQLRFFAINAYQVAKQTGMGARINTIMQTCFFALSDLMPTDLAIEQIKSAIRKSYGAKGDEVVAINCAAVDQALENLHEISVPAEANSRVPMTPPIPSEAPAFMQKVTAKIAAGFGDELPVSAIPADGSWPTGSAQWEKRGLASEVPIPDLGICIQCGKCAIACPHAAIRSKVYDPELLKDAPEHFKSVDARGKEFVGLQWSLQVAPEDCTGCGICVEVCPARDKHDHDHKAITLESLIPLRDRERENYRYFLDLPEFDRSKLNLKTVKGSQLAQPLFEYSGACAGCGETPYIKLLTQLFGDRAIIGNATGCSSIYSGNLPTTPYTTNPDGRGPAWNNSLFEDCAEFTLGFRLTADKQNEHARELVAALRGTVIDDESADALLNAGQTSEGGIAQQRARVEALKIRLTESSDPRATQLLSLADALVVRSIWALGGDGWAYDIGYGGLDHVLASGRNVNVMVMDTQVYSNTGGQCSKATPLGAVAKFAAAGKPVAKKDLGMMAITYGNVYVAQIAMGASDNQTVKALVEAESYDGPSLVIAYGHCIAHGINMTTGFDRQKAIVQSGAWPLYRYDPRRTDQGLNPMQLDSKEPTLSFSDYASGEGRFKMLAKLDPEAQKELMAQAQKQIDTVWHRYRALADQTHDGTPA